jgi:hypothetical protein
VTESVLTIVEALRQRADLYELNAAGWALAQINIPRVLREAAERIEALELENAELQRGRASQGPHEDA